MSPDVKFEDDASQEPSQVKESILVMDSYEVKIWGAPTEMAGLS